MSSKLVKSQRESKPIQNVAIRGPFSAKPKKVPVKFGTKLVLSSEFVPLKELKDSFVMVMGSDTGTIQYTFHRPIGHTMLLKDVDWVVTRTSDIHYLLERIKDVDANKKRARINQAMTSLLIEAKLLYEFNDDYFYLPTGVGNRNTIINDARERLIGNQQVSKDKLTKPVLTDFIQPEYKKLELAIIDFKANKANMEKAQARARVSPYWTRGGPSANDDQKALPYLRGLSSALAKDVVTRQLLGLEITEEFKPLSEEEAKQEQSRLDSLKKGGDTKESQLSSTKENSEKSKSQLYPEEEEQSKIFSDFIAKDPDGFSVDKWLQFCEITGYDQTDGVMNYGIACIRSLMRGKSNLKDFLPEGSNQTEEQDSKVEDESELSLANAITRGRLKAKASRAKNLEEETKSGAIKEGVVPSAIADQEDSTDEESTDSGKQADTNQSASQVEGT